MSPRKKSQGVEKRTNMRADRYTPHANSVHPQNKDKKIFFLSFSHNTIYGIIIIKSRFTFSRKRKLKDFK